MTYLSALLLIASSLIPAWLLDRLLGDPPQFPHPIVFFGKAISWGEKRLNRGNHRLAKGALLALGLISVTALITWGLERWLSHFSPWTIVPLDLIFLFYSLAGTTLCREVRMVFDAVERSEEEGRKQVARIVGRDTSTLSAQEIRTAALETLAENLSDGVVAPLFYYLLFGLPGILTYKMINTLDSMIGYHSTRYILFGRWAARIDDVANYIPARLTALLMLLVSGRLDLLGFVWREGKNHASPNSGYPEAALAGILQCQFGGPHYYFGELFDKPYIGNYPRELTLQDTKKGIRINQSVELAIIFLVLALRPLLL